MSTVQSQGEPGPVNNAANRHALPWAGAGLLALLLLTLVFHQALADSSSRAVRECVHVLLVAGLFFTYLRGYRAIQASPDASRSVPAIVGFAAVFSLVALFIKPFHSDDIYCYINTGWLQLTYGLNPYVSAPDGVPGWQQDPMFHAEWSGTHAAYGFLFTALTKLLCWIGQGDRWTTLLLFKAMNVVVFGLSGWMVWLGCRRLQVPAPRALYLFLWNPLLLIHVIADGHNDLMMGLFTAGSIVLVLRGAWLWVLPTLLVGVLIKFGSVLLMPFMFLYLVRRHGWTKAVMSAGLALVVAVAATAPWLEGDAFVHLAGNATAIHNSLPALVYFPFEVLAKPFPSLRPYEDLVVKAIKLTFYAAFLALLVWTAQRRLRATRYEPAAFVRDCLLIQFVLVCLVSSKYYVWYLGMFFPLAFWVSADDWLHRATLALSCAQLLGLTFVGQSHGLNVAVMVLAPLAWALWPTLSRVPTLYHGDKPRGSPNLASAYSTTS